LYEKGIEKTYNSFPLDLTPYWKEALQKNLAKKRAVGIKKYGAESFQHNLNNSLNCSTIEHALDELLDCMNYLLHEIMIRSTFLYPVEKKILQDQFRTIVMVYDNLIGIAIRTKNG
jgi:hypothetical protein